MLSEDIKKISELLEKATPGEWSSDKFLDAGGGRSLGGTVKHIRVSTPILFAEDGVFSVTAKQRDADVELIVSLRNAATALLDELARLRVKNAVMQRMLENLADSRTQFEALQRHLEDDVNQALLDGGK